MRKSQGAPGFRKTVVGLTRKLRESSVRVPRNRPHDPRARMGFWPTCARLQDYGDITRIARCQFCGASKRADSRWFGECCADLTAARQATGMTLFQIVLRGEHEATHGDLHPLGYRKSFGAMKPNTEQFDIEYLDRIDHLVSYGG